MTKEDEMKNVLNIALFKAAGVFLAMLVLLIGLQYMAWRQSSPVNNLIIYRDYYGTNTERYAIIEALGLRRPFLRDLWPFNRPLKYSW
jgi:hypothetical protein